MKNFQFTGCVILFLIIGCSSPEKKEIPSSKFADIYIDLILAEGMREPIDSLLLKSNDEVSDSIFQKHKVTVGQIKLTIDNYNKDINKWKEFYKIVIEKLKHLQPTESN
ncbi:MAG: DUF4296 domain-containing protein [Bacteroidota bacterium]|nr:DUF4296 domain-containing protein [Bacteroidota bacterium]